MEDLCSLLCQVIYETVSRFCFFILCKNKSFGSQRENKHINLNVCSHLSHKHVCVCVNVHECIMLTFWQNQARVEP